MVGITRSKAIYLWGPPKLGNFKWLSHDDDAQKKCPNDILHRYLHFFHKILQTPCFLKCVCMFLQCFPSKHGNLHICRHKAVPKHHFLQCFQFPCFPKPLKTPLFTLFSSIFRCANSRWPTQTYTKNPSKTFFFPTCQVRVVRFYVSWLPPAASCRLLPPPAVSLPPSAAFRLLRTSTTTIHAKCSLPDLNRENPRPVFPAGPQPRPSTPSVPCRTSTATIHAKCSLPDLNRENPRPVFPAGPQPRPSTPSVPCQTSTATIHAQCSLPDLNRENPRPVFPAGPQPRPSTPSVPCRTSTATIHAKCSLPDLNRENPRPVFPAGPQPRPSTPSVPCQTSTATIHAQCSLPDLNRRRECQKICQIECQIERQIECQIECQIRMPDKNGRWNASQNGREECQIRMPDKNAR